MNPDRASQYRPLSLALACILLAHLLSFGCANNSGKDSFRFVFMPDIHLTTKHKAVEGFRAAIRSVNEMNPRPDFVITGGAVCAAWRTGSFEGWPEGYIVADVKGDSFTCAFHLYGWNAESGNAG